MKIVIGLSGGMDSTTLLATLLDQEHQIHCCIFHYGSKHNKWENEAAGTIISYYEKRGFHIPRHIINLTPAMLEFKSALLLTGPSIPEGYYEAESMRQTVVPGRNMIMAAVMAGLAESVGADAIALGVHRGDHHIYPDCRKEFIKALDSAVYLSSNHAVEVLAPLMEDTKLSILEKGKQCKLPVPYHLTRTCYKDQEKACGKCGSCTERLEAFSDLGMTDPVEYE